MSRSRRLNRTRRAGLAIDLTAMVDVVFLLIIFFMVSTTFITLESGIPVDLPEAQTSQTQMADLPTVTVTRDGQIYLAGTEIAETDLVAALRNTIETTGITTVVLRADSSVTHGIAVQVYDMIKQAGALRIAIATGG
jgi:biopolymer transport protein ExbD